MFRHKSYLTADEIIAKLLVSNEYYDLVKNQIDLDSLLLEGALLNNAKDLATSIEYGDYIEYINLEILQINDTNFKHIWINNDMPILISTCNN